MVWEASEWDFVKKEGWTERLLKFTMDADGNQNKCEEVCKPWNAFCTAKFKEVRQAGRDAFACQTREDTLTQQQGATFDKWLKPRQIDLRPLLWEVSCDAYTRFKSSYEAAHSNKPCFGVCRFTFDSVRVEGVRSAILLSRQGVVIPFTTYTHTLKHMYHPRCQSCL